MKHNSIVEVSIFFFLRRVSLNFEITPISPKFLSYYIARLRFALFIFRFTRHIKAMNKRISVCPMQEDSLTSNGM